jgi:hypothetical protein
MDEFELNNLHCILDHDHKVVKISHDGGSIPIDFKNLTDKEKKSITEENGYLVIPWKLFEKAENIADIKFKDVNGEQIDPCTGKAFKRDKNDKYIIPETNPQIAVSEVTFLPISYLNKHKSKFMKYAKGVGIGIGVVGLVALNIIPGVGEVADAAAIGALGTETAVATTTVAETAAVTETAAVAETAAVTETAETAAVSSEATEAVTTEGTKSTSEIKKGYTHLNSLGDHLKNAVNKVHDTANKGLTIIKDTHEKILNTTKKIQDHIDSINNNINETKKQISTIHKTFTDIGSSVNNIITTSGTSGSGPHEREQMVSNYKIIIVLLIVMIIIVIYMLYIAYKNKSPNGSIFSVI